uniref:SMP-30/Gluconolactonase/LRE-like region domain-containing protein n=1 Tax=Guillardia theta TaxID=55529 RepID=A0A7S4UHD3_GUITH|mmetsp:Transcript_40562/g.127867  ORF Transcript_40562/g.127867 Transcript_40562/m.127867 type:complete len:1154 (+) Transcript_40562:230-3691(+)
MWITRARSLAVMLRLLLVSRFAIGWNVSVSNYYGSSCSTSQAGNKEIVKPDCMTLTSRALIVCDQRDSSRLLEILLDERANPVASKTIVDQPSGLIRGIGMDHVGVWYYTNPRDQTVNLIVEGKSWILAGHRVSVNLRTMTGKGLYATFRSPHGVVADEAQNLFVTDRLDHRVRKVSKSNNFVSYFAGSGIQGFRDGAAGDARFSEPLGIIHFRNKLYVADSNNHAIRSIDPISGEVATVAGNQQRGNLDGAASQSQLDTPTSLVAYKQFIFIAESKGGVRAVDLDSLKVFTLHQLQNVMLSGIAVLNNPYFTHPLVLVSDFLGCRILSLPLVADCAGKLFSSKALDKCGVCGGKDECVDCAGVPWGKAVKDSCGTCRADGGDCSEPNGRVEGGAGDLGSLARSFGVYAGKVAGTFRSPTLKVAESPQMKPVVLPRTQVAVQVNNRWGLRVSTLYGTGMCQPWYSQSSYGNQLNRPEGVVFDSHGHLYVADTGNHVIKMLDFSSGKVLRTIGTEVSSTSNRGSRFGVFNGPSGLSLRGDGGLYVCDSYNSAIRKVDLTSTPPRVSSLQLQRPISSPRGIAFHPSGSLLVTDAEKRSLWEVGSAGMQQLDSRSFPLGEPRALACDPHGDILVADLSGRVLLYQTRLKSWRTLVSKGAMPEEQQDRQLAVSSPSGLAVDGKGNIFIADRGSHCIYMLEAKSSKLLLIAGNGHAGRRDGERAQFYQPYDLALSAEGKVLAVTEKGSCQVRLIHGIESFLKDDSKVAVGSPSSTPKVSKPVSKPDQPSPPPPPPPPSSSSSSKHAQETVKTEIPLTSTPPVMTATKEDPDATAGPSESLKADQLPSSYREFDELEKEAQESSKGVVDPFAYTSKIDRMKKAEGEEPDSDKSVADLEVAGGRIVDVKDPEALPADFVARVEEERAGAPDLVKKADELLAQAGSSTSEIDRIKLNLEGEQEAQGRGEQVEGKGTEQQDSLSSEIERIEQEIAEEDAREMDQEKLDKLLSPLKDSPAPSGSESSLPTSDGTRPSSKKGAEEFEELFPPDDPGQDDKSANVSTGNFRSASVVAPGHHGGSEDMADGKRLSNPHPPRPGHFDDGFSASADVELMVPHDDNILTLGAVMLVFFMTATYYKYGRKFFRSRPSSDVRYEMVSQAT